MGDFLNIISYKKFKHEIGSPLSVPILAHIGELRLIHPRSIIFINASAISGLYNLSAAALAILSMADFAASPLSK